VAAQLPLVLALALGGLHGEASQAPVALEVPEEAPTLVSQRPVKADNAFNE
jgi:hypothetical protein